MTTRFSTAALLVFAAMLVAPIAEAFAHGVAIGRTAAGVLTVHIEAHMPVQLPPSIFPGIVGWADSEPGITSAELEEPDEDFYLLDGGSNLQFIYVGSDPGVQIVTDHVWSPAETYEFGPSPFDAHLIFNIPAGPIGDVYALQFRVHDLNGVHGDSPTYDLLFTAVANLCLCRGDTDEDDALTGADVEMFVHCLLENFGGEPDAHCTCADIDGDGVLDDHDIEHFVEHLLESEECG